VLVTILDMLGSILYFISNGILSVGYILPIFPGSDYAAILADSPSSDDGNILTKDAMDALWELHELVLEIEVCIHCYFIFASRSNRKLNGNYKNDFIYLLCYWIILIGSYDDRNHIQQ